MIRASLGAPAMAWLLLATPLALGQSRLLPTQMPTESQLERLGLTRHWESIVPSGSVDEEIVHISRVADLLIVQTSQGLVYAYDAQRGARRWVSRSGTNTSFPLPAAANSKLVFVANGSQLIGFDRARGTSRLVIPLNGQAASPPVADETTVMIGQINNRITTFAIRNGQSTWNVATAGPNSSRPVLTSRVAAFGSTDGRLFVMANQELRNIVLFRFETGGPITAALGTQGNRTLLAASGDGSLYAVDLYTGELRWSYAADGPLSRDFLDSGQFIYMLDGRGTLTSLNLAQLWAVQDPSGRIATLFPADQLDQAESKAQELNDESFRNWGVRPRPEWTTPDLPGSMLALSPTRIYMRDYYGSLFVVSRKQGSIISNPVETLKRAALDLRPFKVAYTNEIDDRMYLASPEGLIICLRELALIKPAALRPASERPFGFLPGVDDRPSEEPAAKAAAPAGDIDVVEPR